MDSFYLDYWNHWAKWLLSIPPFSQSLVTSIKSFYIHVTALLSPCSFCWSVSGLLNFTQNLLDYYYTVANGNESYLFILFFIDIHLLFLYNIWFYTGQKLNVQYFKVAILTEGSKLKGKNNFNYIILQFVFID